MDKKLALNINKNVILNLAIAVAALLLAMRIHAKLQAQVANLQEQKSQEELKNEVVKRLTQQETKLNTYEQALYNKDTNALVNTMNQLAQGLEIKIISMQPNLPDDKDTYSRLSVNIKLQAKDYHSLGKFISALEKSRDLIKIDVLSVISRAATTDEKQPLGLDVSMVVSVISHSEK